MVTRYDVIVIGAGVAGSVSAILLAKSGWRVALIEKRPFPRRKVCGECIAATNLALLDALGVGEDFRALAGPSLERVGLFVGDETLSADFPRYADSSHPWGRALGREHLDSRLLARAASFGADVWQPWRVTRLTRSEGRHVCELVGPSHRAAVLTSPVVVSAYGSWESVPLADMRRRAPPRASDLFAFKANFIGADLAPGYLPVLAFPGGYGGMVIADHGRLTLACCIRRDQLRACRAGISGAGAAVQALLTASCKGVRQALKAAERCGPWLGSGPIRPGMREPWQEQTGFAVGNAAGEAHPILGEGISMAIQGAWLLAGHLIEARSELLAGDSQAVIGRRYTSEWRSLFSARIRWAAAFAHLAMRPAAARPLLPILRRWPALLALGARLGGKIRGMQPAGHSFAEDILRDSPSSTR